MGKPQKNVSPVEYFLLELAMGEHYLLSFSEVFPEKPTDATRIKNRSGYFDLLRRAAGICPYIQQ